MSRVSNLHEALRGLEANGFSTGMLNRMSHLEPTSDLKSSEIRLFCDNDARWEERDIGGWKDETKYVEGYSSLVIEH